MIKQRNYVIEIYTPEGIMIEVKPPFSVQFNIERNTFASANKGNITIFNLASDKRDRIYKDKYDTANYWQVKIFAGYNDDIYQVFQGNIYEAMTEKKGVDWITTIQAFDGMQAIQNGFLNTTFEKGAKKQDLFSNAINNAPDIVEGIIGETDENGKARGQVQFGQIQDNLPENAYIDNEKVNILNSDEYIGAEALKVDGSILLNTPQKKETNIIILTELFANVNVGNIVDLTSNQKQFNGQYKIVGIKHNFDYMATQMGDCTTEMTLFYGTGEGFKLAN
jgi:hypothetical protein